MIKKSIVLFALLIVSQMQAGSENPARVGLFASVAKAATTLFQQPFAAFRVHAQTQTQSTSSPLAFENLKNYLFKKAVMRYGYRWGISDENKALMKPGSDFIYPYFKNGKRDTIKWYKISEVVSQEGKVKLPSILAVIITDEYTEDSVRDLNEDDELGAITEATTNECNKLKNMRKKTYSQHYNDNQDDAKDECDRLQNLLNQIAQANKKK